MWTNRRLLGTIALFLSAVSFFIYHADALRENLFPQSAVYQQDQKTEIFHLTDQRRAHILFGDGTGGGHRAGAGKPGKTEFPVSWSDEKIIAVVMHLANDAALPIRQSGRRYWIKTGEEEGLQIRIVLDREKSEIITAYPVNKNGDVVHGAGTFQ